MLKILLINILDIDVHNYKQIYIVRYRCVHIMYYVWKYTNVK